ncbi:hypothetical protein BC833DRAFT_605800 [Globomyces pollinis-pini]|nr:hypothetical protein BC833DRAFT_605800 [Globomyces pollinis-pini]
MTKQTGPTKYLIRRYSKLFHQYFASYEVETNHSIKDDRHKIMVEGLGVQDFCDLLNRIGPTVSIDEAQKFIYEYDSTLLGCLNHTDFLDFMGDYTAVIKKGVDLATKVYKDHFDNQEDDNSIDFITMYPKLESYLAAVGFDDPENLTNPINPLTKSIEANFYLQDDYVLCRNISIRIFSIENIQECFKYMIKRRTHKLEYYSIDPFIRVTCGEEVKETTVLISSSSEFNWEQTLELSINIPKGNISDIHQWVQIQNIEFQLFDSNNMGLKSSVELIAYASMPLIRILMNPKKSFNAVLIMNRLDCDDRITSQPTLEVSFMDRTSEKYSWAKVADAYPSCEDVWLMKHDLKIRKDLGSKTLQTNNKSDEKTKKIEERIWALFLSTLHAIHDLFPLRDFRLIAMDEFQDFRFLCSFIQPINSLDAKLNTLPKMAEAVAHIPYQMPHVYSQASDSEYMNDIHPYDSKSLAGWIQTGYPGSFATETFMGPIGSPSTVVSRRGAGLVEHANLLCSLFRGKSINAFVALGEVKYRPYAWVVTIIPRSEITKHSQNDQSFMENQFYHTREQYLKLKYNDRETDFVYQQNKFAKLNSIQLVNRFNEKYSILHWDPLSGLYYTADECPYDVLNTLYYNQNIYFNVQSTNDCTNHTFSYDLFNSQKWIPFLTTEVIIHPGQIISQCEHPVLDYYPFEIDAVAENHRLVKELVDWIQLYRNHILLIPKTNFNRNICKLFQYLMDIRSKSGPKSSGTKNFGMNTNTNDDRILEVDENVIEENEEAEDIELNQDPLAQVAKSDSWWTDLYSDNCLQKFAIQLIPNHHFWYSQIFEFLVFEIILILGQ